MMEPSAFLAVFPYALIASFPIAGMAIVTKWVLDDRKKSTKTLYPVRAHGRRMRKMG